MIITLYIVHEQRHTKSCLQMKFNLVYTYVDEHVCYCNGNNIIILMKLTYVHVLYTTSIIKLHDN